jgi:hypothetical protein
MTYFLVKLCYSSLRDILPSSELRMKERWRWYHGQQQKIVVDCSVSLKFPYIIALAIGLVKNIAEDIKLTYSPSSDKMPSPGFSLSIIKSVNIFHFPLNHPAHYLKYFFYFEPYHEYWLKNCPFPCELELGLGISIYIVDQALETRKTLDLIKPH